VEASFLELSRVGRAVENGVDEERSRLDWWEAEERVTEDL